MKIKIFFLFFLLFFTAQSVMSAPLNEQDVKVHIEEVASSPLEPKGQSDVITIPEIERDINSIVVDEQGKITKKVQTKKNVDVGDFQTMAVGAKIATVAIAADEEFRNTHGSNWTNRARDLVEEMDDAFNRDHSFDLDIKVFIGWNSSGSTEESILGDLRNDWGSVYSYDFLIGFSNESDYDLGGMAYQYTSAPSTMAVSTVKGNQSYSGIWHAGQHELSHNFGLGHHTDSTNCIMNYDYLYSVDTWEATHDNLIEKNEAWYGRSY